MIPKDPVMLLSFINLKLRDFYPSLEAFCEDTDEDMQAILAVAQEENVAHQRV